MDCINDYKAANIQYAGVSNGQECKGGTQAQIDARPKHDDSECNMPCIDGSDNKCGGACLTSMFNLEGVDSSSGTPLYLPLSRVNTSKTCIEVSGSQTNEWEASFVRKTGQLTDWKITRIELYGDKSLSEAKLYHDSNLFGTLPTIAS